MKKQKYYGFDGCSLVLIGEFENIAQALESESGDFFYTTTLPDWAIFAQNIIAKTVEELEK